MRGEFYGIYGTFGVPVIVGNKGVGQVVEIPLEEGGKSLLVQSAKTINQKLKKYME